LVVHSGKKHNWQEILWENMIGSTFWEKTMTDSTSGKNEDFQLILGKNLIGSAFWEKNMIGSTFWKKY
jgi:hypothetical protein